MKKRCTIVVLMLLVITILSANPWIRASSPKEGDVDWWSMVCHDLGHSGVSTSPIPINVIHWIASIGGTIVPSPAVVNHCLYFGSSDHRVYCFNASTGSSIWSYLTGSYVCSSPAVVDSRVYIGSHDDKVYCLNAINGGLLWSYQTGGDVWSSPAVVNERVYVASLDTKIYCLNAVNGSLIWNYQTEGEVWSSPAVVNNRVYIGSNDNKVYCVNAVNGSLVWSYQTEADVTCSPTVYDGRVYVASSKMYCLDAENGHLIWNYPLVPGFMASPAVAYDRVYIGTNTGLIYCLNTSQGGWVWDFQTGSEIRSSPAIVNGQVFVASNNGILSCLDAVYGTQKWNRSLGYQIKSSLAIANGFLYVTRYATGNNIYCLGRINSPPGIPNTPSGLNEGSVGIVFNFSTNAISDPEGDNVYYLFDWGDGTTSEWVSSPVAGHLWRDEGIYQVRAKARDEFWYESEWSIPKSITIQASPPIVPAAPSGPDEGMKNLLYRFTAFTTDPKGNNVSYLFHWGDGTTSGWSAFVTSGTPVTEFHIWPKPGIYNITVNAKDIYDDESLMSQPHQFSIINQTAPYLALYVTPSVVQENKNFTAMVTLDGAPVGHASVIFLGATYFTNTTGMVTLLAPQVDKTTSYNITATYSNYPAATALITILNTPTTLQSWIFGVISDTSGHLVQDAMVCILLSPEELGKTKECVFTDDQGRYFKAIAPGVYTIEVTKQGYNVSTKANITVHNKEAVEENLIIRQSGEPWIPDEIREQINKAIKAGDVGGEILFQQQGNNVTYEKTIYTDITIEPIEINASKGRLSLVVGGNEENRGSTIIITIAHAQVLDLTKQIAIDYDGKRITRQADNLTDILNPNDDGSSPEYFISTRSAEGLQILVSIPHFSEHVITISSIIEILSKPLAILVYITIYVIGIIAFIYPIFSGTVRLRRKKKL